MTDSTYKKRSRPSWKDLPAFLDASASVSATTFGARRLPELKALWSEVQQQQQMVTDEYASGGGKKSSRHLRRRTTSHAARKRHRYPRGDHSKPQNDDENEPDRKPSRKARRKRALLRHEHDAWQSTNVRWLMTHLWHAKRFHMHLMYNWKVPILHANRGARCALRMAAEQDTLLQDVTWRMQPLLVGANECKDLVSALGRMCPNLVSGLNEPNAILSGCSFGQGMLHEPDCFPAGAMGPALWWICRQPMDMLLQTEKMWWIHLFVHPGIRDAVRKALTTLANDSSLEGPRDLQQGLAYFQLRGVKSTKSLVRAIGPVGFSKTSGNDDDDRNDCYYDWDKTSTVDDLHERLPHLTAISAQYNIEDTDKNNSKAVANKSDGCLPYIDSYKATLRDLDPLTMPGRSAHVSKGTVVLVAQSPRDPSLIQNAGACGWDIVCHSSDASAIFLALTQTGEARAIGLIEEAHISLESEPPLLVYPRDYPDTAAGESYWKGNHSEWNFLRQCLEHGWGRVPVVRISKQNAAGRAIDTHTVCWKRISTLPENLESVDTASGVGPVVVRGDFGKPFLEALSGCGHMPPDTAWKKKRRPRRRVKPPTASVPMRSLSSDEAAAHHDLCETLLQSLSLPALIFSHIKVEGKGTISGGERVYVSMNDNEEPGCFDFLLGETVAGSFSMTRGFVHGVGFVGASRLLHALCHKEGRQSGVVARCSDGRRRPELKVLLKRSTGESCVDRSATLSLLL